MRQPDDTLRVRADPAAFGADLAQGAQQLGAGATKAGVFFGQVAADDASNQFQDAAMKIMRGDPTKMVAGPDGKQQPDTGYLGLRGRAALDARPGTEAQIDGLLKTLRTNLQTPEQQFQFENFSRRYRSKVSEEIAAHADGQANTWYGQVNQSSAQLAMAHIAANPDDDAEFNHGLADLRGARIKDAQLKGAQPGDAMFREAVASADRDALKARVEAISVADPTRAMTVLNANKAAAGLYYEPLAQQFRTRAEEQAGRTFVRDALAQPTATPGGARNNNPGNIIDGPWARSQPGYRGAAGAFAVFDSIDSGTAAMAANLRGYAAKGVTTLNQLTAMWAPPPRARADGTIEPLTRGNNPVAYAQRIAAATGIDPNAAIDLTDPATVAKIIPAMAAVEQGHPVRISSQAPTASPATPPTAPSATPRVATPVAAPSGAIVTPQTLTPAIVATPSIPATPVVSTTPPAVLTPSPADRKAALYQQIDEAERSGRLSPGAAQRARTDANQAITAQQIEEGTTAKAKKDASDKAMDGFVKRLLTNDTAGIIEQIANDQSLTPQVKWELGQAAEKQVDEGIVGAAKHYGSGFWDAYKRVLLPADNPARISDMAEVLRQAGPGGTLTLAGADKLSGVMKAIEKSADTHAVEMAKTAALTAAKGKLSWQNEELHLLDADGEYVFHRLFVPQYLSQFDAWVKAGKDPWDFINDEKRFQSMLASMGRSKAQMAADRVAAGTSERPVAAEVQMQPPPQGVDADRWRSIVTAGPPVFSQDGWATAVARLSANPSAENIAAFDASKFGRAGADGAEVLRRLNGGATKPFHYRRIEGIEPVAPDVPHRAFHGPRG